PPRLRLDLRRIRIEEDAELGFVERLLVGDRSRGLDSVGVVHDDAQVPDPPDAGLRADGRLPGLDARVAEEAFFRLARLPVVVDLLVGTSGHAHAPAAAFLLIDEHDAVFLALVDGA